MPWSITVGRVAGAEIRIHLTFLLLLAWVGFADYANGGLPAAFDSVLFTLAVFACVVLHELGHALAARRYGIGTRDITLLPIGGLARLSRLPEKPAEEIVIAIAGPLVNVAIAAVLVTVFGAQLDLSALASPGNAGTGFLGQLAAVNIYLVLFNLIPAFPMDGGRILRALLAFRLGRPRATTVAAWIGQGIALLFGVAGVMSGNYILVFIGIFVLLAARAEAAEANLPGTPGMPVDAAMITGFERLGPNATADDAAEALVRTAENELPVVDDNGRLRGFITRDGLAGAMSASRAGTAPVEVKLTAAPAIRSGAPFRAAVMAMRQRHVPYIGVVDTDNRLIGYINEAKVSEVANRPAEPPQRSAA